MLVLQPEVHGILSLVGVTAILLLHRSLFSLREPGASVAVRGDASNATTVLRQSRRPSAIHRAHPIPSLTPRQTAVGPAKTTAGAMISPEEDGK
jgi:hypothetical protein